MRYYRKNGSNSNLTNSLFVSAAPNSATAISFETPMRLNVKPSLKIYAVDGTEGFVTHAKDGNKIAINIFDTTPFGIRYVGNSSEGFILGDVYIGRCELSSDL